MDIAVWSMDVFCCLVMAVGVPLRSEGEGMKVDESWRFWSSVSILNCGLLYLSFYDGLFIV